MRGKNKGRGEIKLFPQTKNPSRLANASANTAEMKPFQHEAVEPTQENPRLPEVPLRQEVISLHGESVAIIAVIVFIVLYLFLYFCYLRICEECKRRRRSEALVAA